MNPQPLPPPFSVPQLAHRWRCSEGLVRKLIRDGRLHCFRPGSLIRIAVAEVERFECQQQRDYFQVVGQFEITRCNPAPAALYGAL